MRISDWSSDVCSSDLYLIGKGRRHLAFVGHIGLDDSRMADRLAGLRLATEEAGLDAPVAYEITATPGTGQGGEIIGTIIREHPQTRSEERRVGKECVST